MESKPSHTNHPRTNTWTPPGYVTWIPCLLLFLLVAATPAGAEELNITFLDVGQADATLLETENHTILVDAGHWQKDDVSAYLRERGVESIDLLIGTHPHADHIGQMDSIIQQFSVGEVWMSGDRHTSATFERVLDAIQNSSARYNEPRRGEKYQIGSMKIQILNPDAVNGEFNEGCLAFRIVYGDFSLVMTGDMDAKTEREVVQAFDQLDADVFQLGHHGSSTSNSRAFLRKVQPELAVVSCESDNSYGHPHDEVLERLRQMNIRLFGTYRNGTIEVEANSDGSHVIRTEKSDEPIVVLPLIQQDRRVA